MIIYKIHKDGCFANFAVTTKKLAQTIELGTANYTIEEQHFAVTSQHFTVLANTTDDGIFYNLAHFAAGARTFDSEWEYKRFLSLANYLFHLPDPKDIFTFICHNYMKLPDRVIHALWCCFDRYLLIKKVYDGFSIPEPESNRGLYRDVIIPECSNVFAPLPQNFEGHALVLKKFGCDLACTKPNIDYLDAALNDGSPLPLAKFDEYPIYSNILKAYNDPSLISIQKDLLPLLYKDVKDQIRYDIVKNSMSKERFRRSFNDYPHGNG